MELVVVEDKVGLTVEEQFHYRLTQLTDKENKVFNDLQRIWFSKGALFNEVLEENAWTQKEVAKFFGLKAEYVGWYLTALETLSETESPIQQDFQKTLSKETSIKAFYKAVKREEKKQKRAALGIRPPTPKAKKKEEYTEAEVVEETTAITYTEEQVMELLEKVLSGEEVTLGGKKFELKEVAKTGFYREDPHSPDSEPPFTDPLEYIEKLEWMMDKETERIVKGVSNNNPIRKANEAYYNEAMKLDVGDMKRVEKYRTKNGISQRALSKAMGLGGSTYSGYKRPPTGKAADKILDFMEKKGI